MRGAHRSTKLGPLVLSSRGLPAAFPERLTSCVSIACAHRARCIVSVCIPRLLQGAGTPSTHEWRRSPRRFIAVSCRSRQFLRIQTGMRVDPNTARFHGDGKCGDSVDQGRERGVIAPQSGNVTASRRRRCAFLLAKRDLSSRRSGQGSAECRLRPPVVAGLRRRRMWWDRVTVAHRGDLRCPRDAGCVSHPIRRSVVHG